MRGSCEKGGRKPIIDVMTLKLAQASRRDSTTILHNGGQLISILNTPSTLATEKKFHSCQVHRRKPLDPQQSFSLHKHSVSSQSSILTVAQIKAKEQSREHTVRRDKSKGILLSISRKSLARGNPKLQEADCCIRADLPQPEKLKVRKYREIARNRMFQNHD